jgi:hypothetical protein
MKKKKKPDKRSKTKASQKQGHLRSFFEGIGSV